MVAILECKFDWQVIIMKSIYRYTVGGRVRIGELHKSKNTKTKNIVGKISRAVRGLCGAFICY